MIYQETNTDMFYRIFYQLFFIGFGLFVLAAGLFPVYLLFTMPSWWILTVAWMTPFLLWIAWYMAKASRQSFMKEKYLSRYEIKDGRLTGVSYRLDEKPRMHDVDLNDVKRVVVTSYILRLNIHRHTGTLDTHYYTPVTAPALYIVSDDDVVEMLISDHHNPATNEWLQFFADQGIPVTYTDEIMHFIGHTKFWSVKKREKYVRDGSDLVDYKAPFNWPHDAEELYEKWKNQSPLKRLKIDEIELKTHQENQKKKKLRSFWAVILWILMVIALLSAL
ncbi:hypothetical protein [Jeotgalibacillus terrae]|uniref:Uncharacterized protein n=1 Tax=Jeotgalibacillus terrae TaxID=587735 RepID=A0ABW5ZBU6_9BACL|nr:hypothetical protein [Jeotgalibacillus terrae]MBM7577836.1 hypothetical protein [Jeotgalibacillus terrae]